MQISNTEQPIDIEQYFNRIGFRGSTKLGTQQPSLGLLKQLISKHLNKIPFENLNPYLGLGVELDLKAIEHKLVIQHRGGYCFEQNKLFFNVLSQLGFNITPLAARVTVNNDIDNINVGKTHRLSCVEINNSPYLVDVGFGLYTPPYPISLDNLNDIIEHPHGIYRIEKIGQEYRLNAFINQNWMELYRFTMLPALEADYDIANWYLTTHSDAIFTNNIIISRITEQGRYSLRNEQLTFYPNQGLKQVTALHSVDDLLEKLEAIFGLKPQNNNHLRHSINQLLNKNDAILPITRHHPFMARLYL